MCSVFTSPQQVLRATVTIGHDKSKPPSKVFKYCSSRSWMGRALYLDEQMG